jgi:hypothetical protein
MHKETARQEFATRYFFIFVSLQIETILVQRETDIVHLRLIEYLAFGKEVFLGIREFWLTISRKCAGRPV